jgi:hypothetical protein
MTNELEIEPSDTILMLPSGISSSSVVALCREAALEFINDSKHWGKAELGMWLQASYAPITKLALKEEGDGTVWPVPLLRAIDARLIARIMQSARAEVFDALQRIATDGSASFVLRALISGTVIRCEDGASEPAWTPTPNASRLAERVLSLFAVDYLAHPAEYETELAVCLTCEVAQFDAAARHCPRCSPSTHSIVSTRRRPTLPYPPLGA